MARWVPLPGCTQPLPCDTTPLPGRRNWPPSLCGSPRRSTAIDSTFAHGDRQIVVVGDFERTWSVSEYPVIPCPSDELLDTNGAGDAFVGGFLAGMAKGVTQDECAAMGNYCATTIIKRSGTILRPKLRLRQVRGAPGRGLHGVGPSHRLALTGLCGPMGTCRRNPAAKALLQVPRGEACDLKRTLLIRHVDPGDSHPRKCSIASQLRCISIPSESSFGCPSRRQGSSTHDGRPPCRWREL